MPLSLQEARSLTQTNTTSLFRRESLRHGRVTWPDLSGLSLGTFYAFGAQAVSSTQWATYFYHPTRVCPPSTTPGCWLTLEISNVGGDRSEGMDPGIEGTATNAADFLIWELQQQSSFLGPWSYVGPRPPNNDCSTPQAGYECAYNVHNVVSGAPPMYVFTDGGELRDHYRIWARNW